MKDIAFQRVRMENFGPYIDPMELQFVNGKLTMITGPNGAGKTMMFDALPFCLFGITSKGARNEDVVNNIVGKNCKVEVDFSINDDQYNIARYVKYTRIGNTVILKKNGKEIKKGHKDVVPEIENIISPRNLFMNTRLFGQKVKDFFTDLIDSEKKDIFRKILSFQKWEARYDLVKDALKDIKFLIDEKTSDIKVTEGKIEEIETQLSRERIKETLFNQEQEKLIESLEDGISDEKEHLNLLNKSLKNLREMERILAKDVDGLKGVENTFNELSQKTKQFLESLSAQKARKESELRETAASKEKVVFEEFNKERIKFTDMINTIQQEILKQKNVAEGKKGKIESEASYLHGQVLSLNNTKEELVKVLNSDIKTCPTCRRDIDDDAISHLQTKIKACENEMQNLKEQMKQKSHTIDGIKEKLKEVLRQLDSEKRHQESQLEHAEESYNQMVDVYSQRLRDALSQVNEIANKAENDIKIKYQAEKEELEKTYNEFVNKQEKLVTIKDEIDQKTRTIARQESDIENLELRLEREKEREFDRSNTKVLDEKKKMYKDNIEMIKEQLTSLKREQKIAEVWKAGFSPSGIPSMLIDESIPFMNERVMEYLDRMSDGRYVVSFDTLSATKAGDFRDKISVNVLDTATKANSRVQFSGGQTRLVDIATILTLGDLQERVQDVRYNILLFDEIFDSLDDENIGYVSKVLRSIVTDKHILIISHRHVEQLEADEVLEIGK